MEWEIGLVPSFTGAATEIVGAFLTAEGAARAACERNEERKAMPRSYPRWMWAEKGEITRAIGCIDRTAS